MERRGGGKNAGWRLQGRMKEVDGDQENYFWSGNVGAGEGERKADNAGNGRIFGVCRHSLFCRKFITTTVFFPDYNLSKHSINQNKFVEQRSRDPSVGGLCAMDLSSVRSAPDL